MNDAGWRGGTMSRKLLFVFSALLVFSASVGVFYSPPARSLEKLTDDELRQVTGQAGFIDSEEDLETLKSARNSFESLIRSQGLESFLTKETRSQLLDDPDLKPDRQAEVLVQTSRELLTSPKFLKQVEQAGRALVDLSKALRQLQNLR
jgi:hypothetical protein